MRSRDRWKTRNLHTHNREPTVQDSLKRVSGWPDNGVDNLDMRIKGINKSFARIKHVSPNRKIKDET